MKKLQLTLVGIILAFNTFSQSSATEKKRISFGVSLEQRITPVYLSKVHNSLVGENIITPVFYEEDPQLSGTAVSYNISYHFMKINSSLIFSQSFRYDHIYFDTKLLHPNTASVNRSVNDLITDYHFILKKSFNLKNDYALNLCLGYSLMNRGTDYSYTRQAGEYNGEPLYSTTSGDFQFSAFNVALGIEKQKLDFTIGSYITDKNKYNQPSQVLIPYLKLTYNLSLQ